jgi:hypothetical protein
LSDPAPTLLPVCKSSFAISVLTWMLQVHTPSRISCAPRIASLLMKTPMRWADITVLLDRHPSKAGVQTCGCLEEDVLVDNSITDCPLTTHTGDDIVLRTFQLTVLAGMPFSCSQQTVHHCNDDS